MDKGPYAPPERGARRRTTVAETAELLSISAEPVRGRIRRGTLPVEREGGTVYVLLDPTAANRTDDDRPADRTDALISALVGQVEDLREQLRAERQGHAEARRLLAAALERILAIEAPQEPPEASETAHEQHGRSEPLSDAPGAQEGPWRPWWRRVFGS